MAAGYRSLLQKQIGGAGSNPSAAIRAGNKCILPGYLGRGASYSVTTRAGYRSMLAYWLGGACSYAYVKPPDKPQEPGGPGTRAHPEMPLWNDEDDLVMLVPCFITVMEECCG